MPNELRYSITDWHQAPAAKSNNSDKLHIHVTDLITTEISGLCISVEHDELGTLFATLVNASGTDLTPDESELVFELPLETIIHILYTFGFIIEFDEKLHLPTSQIEFLRSLQGLNFDKLRVLNVRKQAGAEITTADWYVVAFNAQKNPNWLMNMYVASWKEFQDAISSGSAINLSDATNRDIHRWSWNWLNFVANISDILGNQQ